MHKVIGVPGMVTKGREGVSAVHSMEPVAYLFD
jgi:hypothetical protein